MRASSSRLPGRLPIHPALLALAVIAGSPALSAEEDPAWDPRLDAVVAAPKSHRVLFENEAVRVLEVIIQPGEREPAHTHRWPSVMVGLEAARIRYYDARGELRFETPADRDPAGAEPGADWLGPEPLHSVENIDTKVFRALRFELKRGAGGPSPEPS